MIDFRAWVQQQLAERGWSQDTLANLSGVDTSNMLLNNKTRPTLRMAIRLCQGLGLTMADLLDSWRGERPSFPPAGSGTALESTLAGAFATGAAGQKVSPGPGMEEGRSRRGGAGCRADAALVVPSQTIKLTDKDRTIAFKGEHCAHSFAVQNK
jgi:transcriptional regulator with XRE-family HTH domain